VPHRFAKGRGLLGQRHRPNHIVACRQRLEPGFAWLDPLDPEMVLDNRAFAGAVPRMVEQEILEDLSNGFARLDGLHGDHSLNEPSPKRSWQGPLVQLPRDPWQPGIRQRRFFAKTGGPKRLVQPAARGEETASC
jgi:hypothetical protein